ncbi:UNVERIFIED_CONTAM: hypothetical protein FKN15_004103 [Acipenser sinensis]
MAMPLCLHEAKDKVDQRLTDIQAKLQGKEPVEGNYLTYLLSCDKLSQSEIYSSITELLLAGVDTTSNTLSWAIYHLARNEGLQKAVYKEVMSVSPEGQIPMAQDLDKMPLVKAVVREVLRLYPVVPENARILETDIVLGDYHIPSQLVKQFEIRTDPKEKEVTPMTRLLIVPGSPINLQFHDRNP